MTKAKIDNNNFYELRVRDHCWVGGNWTGNDYISKKKAEEATALAIKRLNSGAKSKCCSIKMDKSRSDCTSKDKSLWKDSILPEGQYL